MGLSKVTMDVGKSVTLTCHPARNNKPAPLATTPAWTSNPLSIVDLSPSADGITCTATGVAPGTTSVTVSATGDGPVNASVSFVINSNLANTISITGSKPA